MTVCAKCSVLSASRILKRASGTASRRKAYLRDFLSRIDVPAAINRYSECEANFNGALKDIGIR